MGRMLIPGVLVSTRNCESPSCFLSGTTLVRKSAIMYSEMWALLVHTLVPLTL